MLASFPVSMLNQKPSDLGIPNRFKLDPSRSSGVNLIRLVQTSPSLEQRLDKAAVPPALLARADEMIE